MFCTHCATSPPVLTLYPCVPQLVLTINCPESKCPIAAFLANANAMAGDCPASLNSFNDPKSCRLACESGYAIGRTSSNGLLECTASGNAEDGILSGVIQCQGLFLEVVKRPLTCIACDTLTRPHTHHHPHAPAECFWELPVVSAVSDTTNGMTTVHLGATARSRAQLWATIAAANSTEEVTAEISTLTEDSTTVTVESTWDTNDIVKVFTRHSHPMQSAGAVDCITADLQQVGRC